MNAFAERLMENDLREVLGAKRPPDLTAAILAGLRGDVRPAAKAPAPVHVMRRSWLRLAEAACIVVAFGTIAWLLWPKLGRGELPAGVVAAPGANYSAGKIAVDLKQGWLVVTSGAPAVVAGGDRVSSIAGRAVIKAGPAPTGSELSNMRAFFDNNLSDEERTMLSNKKNWVAGAALAVCVFSGQVLLNGETVEAGTSKAVQSKIKADDVKGIQTLLRGARALWVRGQDDSGRWAAQYDVSDEKAMKAYLDVLAGDLEYVEGPAARSEWKATNLCGVTLSDGGNATFSIYGSQRGPGDATHMRLTLAGWTTHGEYNVPLAALTDLEPWLAQSRRMPHNELTPSENFRVLRSWNGTDSAIEQPEISLAQTSNELSAIYERHLPGADWELPQVDWSNEMVIAVFVGKCNGQPPVSLNSVLRASDRYIVRMSCVPYQTIGEPPRVTPFGFFVVPYTRSRITIEWLTITTGTGLKRDIVQGWTNRHEFALGSGSIPAESTRFVEDSWTSNETDTSGSQSTLGNGTVKYLTTEKEFDALWQKHSPGVSKPFNVDFEKQAVIAVLFGRTLNSSGIRLDETLVNAKWRVLRLTNDLNLKRSLASYSKPCAFYLVSKSSLETVVEMKAHYKYDAGELVTRADNDPVLYDEVARFKGK